MMLLLLPLLLALCLPATATAPRPVLAGATVNCSAMLPPGTSVRSAGCCTPQADESDGRRGRKSADGSLSAAVVPCSAAATPYGDCATSFPKTNTPQYHVMDRSCDENDPNAPFFDAVHGVFHLFYQKHCGQLTSNRRL